jgi:hypothetical protein
MATHGKARTETIRALAKRKPFKRSSFAMWAIEGASNQHGRLPDSVRDEYVCDMGRIAYTVLSYATPIAWVLTDGAVKVPDVRYSSTTSHHQHLCRAYL